MSGSLQIESEIIETTAAYAGRSEITLHDLPFGALFEQAGVLAGLGQAPEADVLARLDEIEGVQIQQPGTVRARFR